MASPSEPITWTRLGLAPADRVCAVCGRQITLDELCQYHVTVGQPVRLACKTCGPVLA